ncbi:MAG: sulfatase-like hydrolase/transferase [Gammaproteobacteria bacterium]|nr:sulfatase-like hydrolase/transferase [Gammaproteobacteria bacterium]
MSRKAKKKSTLSFLLVAALALLAAVMLQACPQADPDSVPIQGNILNKEALQCNECNFLLLNIELLRADHVGLLNPGKPSNTPNIDRFFKNSILFENVSAPAGETYRSNLATLTAMEAFNFPVSEKRIHKYINRKKNRCTPDELIDIEEMLLKYPTMVQHLKSYGYHTISMNQGIRAGKKLHLDRGFDIVTNWDRRKDSYRQTINSLLKQLKDNIETPYFLLYRPEVLHPMPYYYPDDLKRIEDPERIFNQHKPEFSRFNIRINNGMSDTEIRQTLHEIYAQQVRLVDSELKSIFSYLEKNGNLSNTIVILYANHGSGLGDNGVKKLAVSYQSSVHVPLLILHPAVKHGVRIQTPVTLLDLMPTLIEISGHERIPNINGISLLRDFSKTREIEHPIIGRNDFDEYIRMGHYKLIRKQGNRQELYLLTNDPGEINNIANEEPERTRKMLGILDTLKLDIIINQQH